ncbi:MAG: twin arginine-targeting protein translocase TatC [Desulfuromonadaceae bacterium GWC2_58_13]|nr:MAG: twin arginine-targeting protein translocase TatC [Desulfuromonadaceae bacterium GWC2_58_13]
MPLMAYLETLRKSLIVAGGTWFVAFVALYGFAEELFSWIALPMRSALPSGSSMVFVEATEPFFTYLMLAAVAALAVSLPVILWQVWSLITTGQSSKRKGLGFLFILGGCSSFFGGAYLGFAYVLPVIFSFLINFGTESGTVAAMLSMGEYLSLALKMMLAFGLVFELPVIMTVLARVGLADRLWFASKRKYMLILAFVFGALVTPGPDVVSQCSIAIPFVILYEVGILGAWLCQKHRAAAVGEKA